MLKRSDAKHVGRTKPRGHSGKCGAGRREAGRQTGRNEARYRLRRSCGQRSNGAVRPQGGSVQLRVARALESAGRTGTARISLMVRDHTAAVARCGHQPDGKRENHDQDRCIPHGLILPVRRGWPPYEKLKESKLSGPPDWRSPKSASTQVEPAQAASAEL
jgi:hypothetical protein